MRASRKVSAFQKNNEIAAKTQQVPIMKYRTILALVASVLPLEFTAAYECLSPGELREPQFFNTEVVNNSLTRLRLAQRFRTLPPVALPNPGGFGQALVQFDGNNIKIDASASNPLNIFDKRRVEAFARGKLSYDFRVCNLDTDQTITAAIRFKVKRVGRITTFMPSSTSALGVSARIRDLQDSREIDYRVIEDTSVGNLFGSFKVIAKIPVPIPEISQTERADVETFVIQLRGGRTYRFELFAAARSISGLQLNPVTTPFATANFLDPLVDIGLDDSPGIELLDFSIDVAEDPGQQIEALALTVDSLQQAVADLAAKVDSLDPSLGARMLDLEDLVSENGELIADLEDGADARDERIADLESELQVLKTQIESLQNHTHEYLSGKSQGHNNTRQSTSPPK